MIVILKNWPFNVYIIRLVVVTFNVCMVIFYVCSKTWLCFLITVLVIFLWIPVTQSLNPKMQLMIMVLMLLIMLF
jgi:hypothetical protein